MNATPFEARHTGTPVERIEDLRLLRGEGRYVDDIHVPGMVFAAVVRSPMAHARLRGVDTRAARAMRGVLAVYTAKDVSVSGKVPIVPLRVGSFPQVEPYGQPVIAADKVRYVGEPVALVVAESAALAEDAADAVLLDLEPLPAITDRASLMATDARLFEGTASNIAVTYRAQKGDAGKAVAAYRRRERFYLHRHAGIFMEPRGLLADWSGAETLLRLAGSAKVPYSNRRFLGGYMDLPEDCIEVEATDFGGGFGVRGEVYPEDVLVPLASRKLGRPVKWIEDRRENLLAANHARDVECELEIACDEDGTIVALEGEAWVNVGAYFRMSGAVQPRNVAQFVAGPYRVPHVTMAAHVMVTNKTPTGAYRGPGRYEADFFRERLFDMAARDLKIDPVAFRRRNLVARDEMPYPLPTLTPIEVKDELDSGDYAETLDHCLREIRWDEKSALQGRRDAQGRYHGLAVGCFIEGGAAGPRETARVLATPDGRIDVHVGSANVGQGMETAFSQIAADALGIGMAALRLRHGGTGVLKEAFGSFHSRSIVMGGSAILDAAAKFRQALVESAAQAWRVPSVEVTCGADLSLGVRGEAFAFPEVMKRIGREVSADGVFHNHHHTYAYGAAAAHVAVDPGTGRVALIDYFVVEDVGRVINPLTLKGQLVGAVAQGLGGVLLEHMVYDAEGQHLSASLADYLLPTATDFPVIRAAVQGKHPAPHNPLGAKGGGEGGVVAVAGVISNAVSAALAGLGVEVRTLPLTPPRVWELLQRTARR